jgi:hypothetical protein
MMSRKRLRNGALGAALIAVPLVAHVRVAAASSDRPRHARDGAFGTYIALGIRIGNDALAALRAQPREVDVTLHSGPKSPCPCVIDGVMIVTTASSGQGTLRVAAEPAAEDQIGVVIVRHRKDGRSVRYVIPASAGPKLFAWSKEKNARDRLDVVMQDPAENLFAREAVK